MKYRVGLVGAGENARDHGRACHDSSQVEMVAICDISEVALERFGNEFNIPQRYTNLLVEELFAMTNMETRYNERIQ